MRPLQLLLLVAPCDVDVLLVRLFPDQQDAQRRDDAHRPLEHVGNDVARVAWNSARPRGNPKNFPLDP